MNPATIVDQQIPLLDGSFIPSSGSNTNPVANSDAEAPTTQVDKAFPPVNIAQETISQSLNTETKRILGEYAFESLGAIRIGAFQQGVSGEIDISPDGIAAKNINGDDTFTIDATTGNAVFSGDVRASTFTNDFFNVDASGNVVANSIKISSQSFFNTGAGFNQVFTAPQTDVTGSSIPLTLARSTIIVIQVDILAYLAIASGAGDWGGNGVVRLDIDGGEVNRTVLAGSQVAGDNSGATSITPASLHYITSLAAGAHTIKLTGACDQGIGSSKFTIYQASISYFTLGNS